MRRVLGVFVVFSCLAFAPLLKAADPLILTPYLEQGKIAEAQRLSEIKDLPGSSIRSYSGYLTVNKSHDSNLFFWFIPAETDADSAPLLIWLDGGPGAASVFSLFVQSGPYSVTEDLKLVPRSAAWTKKYSMLYIDNPVGTGFSFTKSEAGYAENENDVARDLYSFITQFVQIFHQYRENDLYIGGESYGGKYVPAMAYKIHTENPKASVHVNLKGIFIGGPFSDPESILPVYGEYLYNVGLFSEKERTFFDNGVRETLDFMRQGQYRQAIDMFESLILGFGTFYNFTGYVSYLNMLHVEGPASYSYYSQFVNLSDVRRAIHVADVPFYDISQSVYGHLRTDILHSVKSWLTTLMDNYKVLLFNGQLDIIMCPPTTQAMLRSMQWKGHDAYEDAARVIWRLHPDDVDVAGYAQQHDNFTFVIVRQAGHITIADQPERCFDMIQRFIENRPFKSEARSTTINPLCTTSENTRKTGVPPANGCQRQGGSFQIITATLLTCYCLQFATFFSFIFP